MTLLQNNVDSYRGVQTLPQRITGLAFVAALHIILITAFLNALGVVPMPRIPMPFVGYLIPPDTQTPPPRRRRFRKSRRRGSPIFRRLPLLKSRSILPDLPP